MFNNKTRARIPSAATIRFLYQLAYISSGTAAGVATLCAEERRRRILILQKIADNARRIQQSPRHVHNAALARIEEPADWAHEDLGSHMTSGGGGRSGSDHAGAKQHITTEAASRISELPSLVEKGYDQVLTMDARWPRPTDFPVNENVHEQSGDIHSADHVQLQSSSNLIKAYDVMYRELRRSGGSRRLRRARPMDRQQSMEASMLRAQPEFRTLKVADGDPSELMSNVKSDVDLFFQSQPWSRRGIIQEVRVADHLLAKALECGSLTEVRSISDWKLRLIGLSHRDLQQICDACSQLALNQDREAILEFYINLLATSSFLAAPTRLQCQLRFGLATEIMTWELPLTNHELINVLLSPVVSGQNRSAGMIASDALHDALDRSVRILLAGSHIDAAVDLIVCTSKCDNELAIPLADLTFQAARLAGHLGSCVKILDWKHVHNQRQKASIQQYEWFIRKCDEQKTYYMLDRTVKSLAKSQFFKWLVPKLSVQAKLVLATACTVQDPFPRGIFKRLYADIPKDVNTSLCAAHSILQLETLWNTTRDLKAVRRLFDELRSNCVSSSKDHSAISITMVEILSSANQPDRALELLQMLNSTHVEKARLACLAAEAMARKKAWGKADALLNAMSKTDGFVARPEVSHHLNRLAYLYCERHGSWESWRYIQSLMRKFHFRPSSSTVQCLLRCSVAHQSLDLIPTCLEYLRTCGVGFRMDTEVAAMLLSVYSQLQRPGQVLLMELCRNLMAIAPWLECIKLVGVIEETIASDLRDAPKQRQKRDALQFWAKQNMARLKQTNELGLPSPSWSHQIPSLRAKFKDIIDPNFQPGLNIESTVIEHASPMEGTTDYSHLISPGQNHGRRRRTEQEIILAFSCDDHEKVLEIYRKSLDSHGLPLSTVALEVATNSALRRHKGDNSEALTLLRDAQAAGMNASCAMGPILIHRMRNLTAASEQYASRLRTDVIEYYRANEENGWKVRHHVAVSAADLLGRNGYASYAVNLLNAIFYSKWAADRPFDIVAMTVYVRSYGILKSIQGISWAVNKVLDGDMRIDSRFTNALKESLERFGHERADDDPHESDQCAYIRQLRDKCLKAEQRQRHKAKVFGIELVQCLAECSLPETRTKESHETTLRKRVGVQHFHLGDNTQTVIPSEIFRISNQTLTE